MMRHRWATLGSFLLVLAMVVAGLGACARSAEERESPTAAATPTSGEVRTVATIGPGETVVSAVTSLPQTPGAGVLVTSGVVQPTLVPVGGTPVTAEPLPTSQPVATATPSTPSGQTGTIWHTVQPGETLSSIARRYGTTWQAIAEANNLVNPSQIYAGQQLKIPTSGGTSGGSSGGTTGCRIRHTVQKGEWLWQIARSYGVSPYDVMAANGLTIQSANPIYAGMVLCIP
jgi:lysozyme